VTGTINLNCFTENKAKLTQTRQLSRGWHHWAYRKCKTLCRNADFSKY